MVRNVAGFEQVESHYPTPKKEFLRFAADLFAWNWSEAMQMFKRVGVLRNIALEEAQAGWERFAVDLNEGTKPVATTTIITVGRKPLDVGVRL